MLGFLTFFGIIGFICYFAVSNFAKIKDQFSATIVAGLTAATCGLLINAIYIDVFEASKVAYMFWIMAAILIATIKLASSTQKS